MFRRLFAYKGRRKNNKNAKEARPASRRFICHIKRVPLAFKDFGTSDEFLRYHYKLQHNLPVKIA